ncbi:BrnA antitoxin family protein [Pararhodobacter aggregans]|uniref:BrnA antitoxin family protein n=1 Tax=Pararhodobacter aggregans TaxID=404875 RepID=UPI003A8F0928
MSESTIKRYTLEQIRAMKSLTDWDRVRRNDEAGVEPEPDEDEFEVDWTSARVVTPEPKQMISLRLDPDILAFFKAEGRGYQTRINAVLRAYMEAQKR